MRLKVGISLSQLNNEFLTCRGLQCLYEGAKKNALPKETSWKSLLPIDVLDDLFRNIQDLNARPAEDPSSEIHALDNVPYLQEAILKVAKQRFQHFNISKQISPYKHLLSIYEAAQENTLCELTRLEINLLPVELRKQIFSHINQRNGKQVEDKFGEDHVLDDPTILKAAIDNVKDSIFEKMKQLAAQGKVRETVEYIEDFGFKNQDALIEIAKLCAKEYAWATAELIQNLASKIKMLLSISPRFVLK